MSDPKYCELCESIACLHIVQQLEAECAAIRREAKNAVEALNECVDTMQNFVEEDRCHQFQLVADKLDKALSLDGGKEMLEELKALRIERDSWVDERGQLETDVEDRKRGEEDIGSAFGKLLLERDDLRAKLAESEADSVRANFKWACQKVDLEKRLALAEIFVEDYRKGRVRSVRLDKDLAAFDASKASP